MSGAYNAVGRAFPYKPAGHLNGCVFFAPQDVRRLFIHVYYFLGMNNVITHIIQLELIQLGFHLGSIAHQQHMQIM